MSPEKRSRQGLDRRLAQAGWKVQDLAGSTFLMGSVHHPGICRPEARRVRRPPSVHGPRRHFIPEKLSVGLLGPRSRA